jgi:hypothetical protein
MWHEAAALRAGGAVTSFSIPFAIFSMARQ